MIAVTIFTSELNLVCVLGLDLCFGRWDNSLHRLTDFGSVIRPPPINKTVIKSHLFNKFYEEKC